MRTPQPWEGCTGWVVSPQKRQGSKPHRGRGPGKSHRGWEKREFQGVTDCSRHCREDEQFVKTLHKWHSECTEKLADTEPFSPCRASPLPPACPPAWVPLTSSLGLLLFLLQIPAQEGFPGFPPCHHHPGSLVTQGISLWVTFHRALSAQPQKHGFVCYLLDWKLLNDNKCVFSSPFLARCPAWSCSIYVCWVRVLSLAQNWICPLRSFHWAHLSNTSSPGQSASPKGLSLQPRLPGKKGDGIRADRGWNISWVSSIPNDLFC